MMELYLVRHAQATNNVVGAPFTYEPPLTPWGARQAKSLAQYLADNALPHLAKRTPRERLADEGRTGFAITHLYCSPMWRSLQTAEILAPLLKLTPEVWIDIHERGGACPEDGGGAYAGKSRQEIQAHFPSFLLPAGITEHGWWFRETEDAALCAERVRRVATSLQARAQQDERILLVSHGAFVDGLIKVLSGAPLSDQFAYHHFNTGITRIDFRPDGVYILYLNRVEHLTRLYRLSQMFRQE